MITASEPLEFVPRGRQAVIIHPGPINASPGPSSTHFDIYLSSRLQNVVLSDVSAQTDNEFWTIRQSEGKHDYVGNNTNSGIGSSFIDTPNRVDSMYEEELYCKGNTAVWSKGLLSSVSTEFYTKENREVICSFNCDAPIRHAVFCTFYSSVMEKPIQGIVSNSVGSRKPIVNLHEPIGKAIPSLCLIDLLSIRVYTEKGEDFITSLEFQVSNVWNTRFGILLEKEAVPDTNKCGSHLGRESGQGIKSSRSDLEGNLLQLPTLFSLGHPLDEMCPLIIKQHGDLDYVSDPAFTVVFASVNPSIIMLFDSKTGLHSVYLLRKALLEEYQIICNEYNCSSILGTQSLLRNTELTNTSESIKRQKGSLLSRHGSNVIGHLKDLASSPYSSSSSYNSPTVSPHLTPIGTPTPGGYVASPMGAISRNLGVSPMPRFHHTLLSPFGNSSPYGSGVSTNITRGTTCSEPPVEKPLYPELCLEHMWTENLGVSKGTTCERGSKCFLHIDLVGCTYLCYLQQKSGCLVLTRIHNVSDSQQQMIFGAASILPAKDVVSLPKMHMMALIDHMGYVMLYSGLNSVGKVHIGGMLHTVTSMPMMGQSHSLLGHSFTSPFPKRSSLLPHANIPPDSQFDELHYLSPVPSLASHVARTSTTNASSYGTNLQGLQDALGDRLTLQYSSGQYFRVILPPISNSLLIKNCLVVLKLLPRDLAMQVMVRWYSVRNAPGSQDISVEQEWIMFRNLLLDLMGYDLSKLQILNSDIINNKESATTEPKKQKTSPEGSNSDWDYLLNSKQHKMHGDTLGNILNINKKRPKEQYKVNTIEQAKINTKAILFANLPVILFSLHLLYEDMKLDNLCTDYLKMIAQFLHQLASDLRLTSYVHHYWKDFPECCSLYVDYEKSQIDQSVLNKFTQPTYMVTDAPDIYKYVLDILNEKTVPPYPYISQVNKTSKNIIQLANLLVYNPVDLSDLDGCIRRIAAQVSPTDVTEQPLSSRGIRQNLGKTMEQRAVLLMTSLGISRREISRLPPVLNLLCYWAIEDCREYPPPDWGPDAYTLLLREDLIIKNQETDIEERCETSVSPQRSSVVDSNVIINTSAESVDSDDGMRNIETQLLRLRFPKDLRISEVRRLLHSASPVTIDITQSPEVSDHEFIEEQEKQLYSISTRTMALPVGRGMFTLRTSIPCTTEPLPVPKLCLTGKAPPRGTTVDLTHIEVPPQMNLWPLFHNGVAAGLKISPHASDIDSTWIVYNKPKTDMPTEHAGFLMALGLNGHLKNLAFMNIYEYLIKCNEMTSVGLLLGISATHRGSMDASTTKLLSIHVEALLPPTSIELDIPQNIQVAALLGVGLVYQGTAHRHIAEVLLSEIGRPPGPEMENSVEREAYSLSAGLSLGLVTLGHGGQITGLADLAIPDTLHYYMVGGNKRPLTGAQKDKYKLPSFQIREGDSVNIDVTAPGATLALGLMFFGTGNKTIADWMKPPETHYMLDFVRPDLLLLRTISRGLILWNDIQPTESWIEDQVPVAFQRFCLCTPNPDLQPEIDYEGLNQAYCNILAGACFCIGLRYAGSGNQVANTLLLKYTQRFMRLGRKPIAELAGKSTIETCMNLILISLSMVMAGTGDLMTLRICRLLRARVGVAGTTTATYGSHLATHMALGLLFLGAGRYTLSTSPSSVAALVCAFFPKFPTHSNDNRYHLQAFRHLYALAVEPRLLIPRDIDSGLLCYCHVSITYLDSDVVEKLKAPCLLPELHKLQSVKIEDSRYWPIVFEVDRNWDQLLKLLEKCNCLDIKQQAGFLSYEEDPEGYKTLLAQTLTTEISNVWCARPENIFSFSNDSAVLNFTKQFLVGSEHLKQSEIELIQLLKMQTYECVTKDILHVLPTRISIVMALFQFRDAPSIHLVWQLKLLSALIENYNKLSSFSYPRKKNMLISNESVLSMTQKISSILDSWEPEILPLVKYYFKSQIENLGPAVNSTLMRKLVSYVTFYEVPFRTQDLTILENSDVFNIILGANKFDLSSNKIKLLSIVNSNDCKSDYKMEQSSSTC